MAEPKEEDTFYIVYPGSEKLDIGPKKAVAICAYEGHAQELTKKYGGHGSVESVNGSQLLKLIEEGLFG